MSEPYFSTTVDLLAVRVYQDRASLGGAATADVTQRLRELLTRQDQVRMVFAAAPSQNELLAGLATAGLDWSRVTVFQMDEYLGLPEDHPQRFANFLEERLFQQVKPGRVELLGLLDDPEAECKRYAALLSEAPIDIVCLGIGENGHLAFNDPPFASFDDRELVKTGVLDERSRRQQVNDGCFTRIEEVPLMAITLTIPALLSASALFAVVPGPTKRAAVRRALYDDIRPACPASILRRHPCCTLFLDRDSYPGPAEEKGDSATV